MPFLPPNQQCQSTEGNVSNTRNQILTKNGDKKVDKFQRHSFRSTNINAFYVSSNDLNTVTVGKNSIQKWMKLKIFKNMCRIRAQKMILTGPCWHFGDNHVDLRQGKCWDTTALNTDRISVEPSNIHIQLCMKYVPVIAKFLVKLPMIWREGSKNVRCRTESSFSCV